MAFLRCTAPIHDYDSPSGIQDAVLSNELSVHYISQKLGLARHMLVVIPQYVHNL